MGYKPLCKLSSAGVGQEPLHEPTLLPPSIIRARTLHMSGSADLPAAPLPCVVHAARLGAQCRDALETRRRPPDLCLLMHLSKRKENCGRCVALALEAARRGPGASKRRALWCRSSRPPLAIARALRRVRLPPAGAAKLDFCRPSR